MDNKLIFFITDQIIDRFYIYPTQLVIILAHNRIFFCFTRSL